MHKQKNIVKLISTLKINIENFLNKSIENENAKGLMISHGNILMQLYREDNQAMSKIAENIGKCKSTLTVLVDKLEKIDFITRTADKDDTRIKKLCLTQKGKDFQNIFMDISSKLNSKLWNNFTKEEAESFLSFLERMNNNISKESSKPLQKN